MIKVPANRFEKNLSNIPVFRVSLTKNWKSIPSTFIILKCGHIFEVVQFEFILLLMNKLTSDYGKRPHNVPDNLRGTCILIQTIKKNLNRKTTPVRDAETINTFLN